jgi:hypothetical protein
MLDATQGGNYQATERIKVLPLSGIICAHGFSDDTALLTKDYNVPRKLDRRLR